MRTVAQLVLLALVGAPVWAQKVHLLYTPSELKETNDQYSASLLRMWREELLPRVTSNERSRAGTVDLERPVVGENDFPLEAYSYVVTRQVFLPTATVKFLDDMTVAYAYYHKMRCDLGVISDYTTVLRFRSEDATGSPLDMLGVPKTKAVLNDQEALNMSKSIVFFVLAHEYAHVMYRHAVDETVTEEEFQQHELDADAFALEVMRRIQVPPTAMTFYFLTSSRLEPIPGDLDYVRQRHSHPASTQRILQVAAAMEAHIADFAQGQKDHHSWQTRLQTEVGELRTLAGTLNNPQMRRLLSLQAQNADIPAFRHACTR